MLTTATRAFMPKVSVAPVSRSNVQEWFPGLLAVRERTVGWAWARFQSEI